VNEIALAEISGRVETVPLIEGMLDEAKRKRGADGGGRSHLNVPVRV